MQKILHVILFGSVNLFDASSKISTLNNPIECQIVCKFVMGEKFCYIYK